jgi:cytidine deaminase
MDQSILELMEAARAARAHAHAPYSNCRVGGAIRLSDGSIFAGCNVENASYGATICAERGAVMMAVAARGKIAIQEVLVLSEATPPWPPCGMCRQVVAEFAAPDCVVHLVNESGDIISQPFSQIFPSTFDSTNLSQTEEFSR